MTNASIGRKQALQLLYRVQVFAAAAAAAAAAAIHTDWRLCYSSEYQLLLSHCCKRVRVLTVAADGQVVDCLCAFAA